MGVDAETRSDTLNQHAMSGGDGLQSYTRNSSYQRSIIDATKLHIQRAVSEKLQLENYTTLPTFCIADLGCSTGPNTFFAVQNILEGVKLKYKTLEHNTKNYVPEFQVLFNDHSLNDFNTLFKCLPPYREYYASAVPGSFHSRLFPRASLHFVHSSYSLHWLSQVPKEVTDKNSPAWNKERIYYSCAKEEVIEAYSKQHAIDMACCLRARAEEVVPDGLVAILIPSRPNGSPHGAVLFNATFDLLGFCLMELCSKGLFLQDKMDSFNIPLYCTSPQEMEQVVEQNGCFSIEIMENLVTVYTPDNRPSVDIGISTIRAVTEELIKKHFGAEILDELFQLVRNKLNEATARWDSPTQTVSHLFLVLKRKSDTNSN